MSHHTRLEHFSTEEDVKLAALVSQHPILYDKSLPNAERRNIGKREETWEEIGKLLNKSAIDCKLRWKNIRDAYARQLSKNKNLYNRRSKFRIYNKMLAFLHKNPVEGDRDRDRDDSSDGDTEEKQNDERRKDINDGEIGKQMSWQRSESFSSEEDEKLVSLISQNPMLYDRSCLEYKNIPKKDSKWEEIAKEMNKTSAECKLRWKAIRDTYVRAKKKTKNPKNRNSKLGYYSKILAFLGKNSDEESNDESIESENSMTLSKMVFLPAIESDQESDNYAGSEENPLIDAEEGSSRERKRCNKRKFREETSTNQENVKQACKSKKAFSSDKDNDDEIDLFTRQFHTVIKKLPPYLQIKAMQEVFDVLTKYKMMAVENSSFQNSQTSSLNVSTSTNDCYQGLFKFELD